MIDRVDAFRDITLGSDLFDWSDQGLTAESIARRLMGYVDHWDDPEFDGMEPMEVERKILFDAGRPAWGGVSKWGKPYAEHMLVLTKLMFPSIDITPSLYDCVTFFCRGIGGGGKKILNLIGSQSSGKSFGSCVLAFVLMYVDPQRSSVFVASPFDVASDAQIWGSVEEMWDLLCEAHPNTTGKGLPDACNLFPWGRKYANRQLELVPGLPKAGTIVLRGVKHVGKFKGAKARAGQDTDRGVMLLVVDEINEVDNPAFLTMINNLVANDQFFAITSQNFKDPEDMGGKIAERR